MSKRSDSDWIIDIIEAARRIHSYCCGLNYEQFLQDTKTQDAVVRNIEIMGEAAKNLSEAFRQRHPNIPWRNIFGMRDRLIHHYFGVNWDIVWNVAQQDIPTLLDQFNG